ncbi:hypothetical protein [Paenibacillus turpanensis]|uniref:hypothetical protein n=1 Tax=Paenibacillus turpanensis TaxID=2689078 RepID=UPI00140B1C28|nr:hypothetical protein [Paenibacillus turpanensis]
MIAKKYHQIPNVSIRSVNVRGIAGNADLFGRSAAQSRRFGQHIADKYGLAQSDPFRQPELIFRSSVPNQRGNGVTNGAAMITSLYLKLQLQLQLQFLLISKHNMYLLNVRPSLEHSGFMRMVDSSITKQLLHDSRSAMMTASRNRFVHTRSLWESTVHTDTASVFSHLQQQAVKHIHWPDAVLGPRTNLDHLRVSDFWRNSEWINRINTYAANEQFLLSNVNLQSWQGVRRDRDSFPLPTISRFVLHPSMYYEKHKNRIQTHQDKPNKPINSDEEVNLISNKNYLWLKRNSDFWIGRRSLVHQKSTNLHGYATFRRQRLTKGSANAVTHINSTWQPLKVQYGQLDSFTTMMMRRKVREHTIKNSLTEQELVSTSNFVSKNKLVATTTLVLKPTLNSLMMLVDDLVDVQVLQLHQKPDQRMEPQFNVVQLRFFPYLLSHERSSRLIGGQKDSTYYRMNVLHGDQIFPIRTKQKQRPRLAYWKDVVNHLLLREDSSRFINVVANVRNAELGFPVVKTGFTYRPSEQWTKVSAWSVLKPQSIFHRNTVHGLFWNTTVHGPYRNHAHAPDQPGQTEAMEWLRAYQAEVGIHREQALVPWHKKEGLTLPVRHLTSVFPSYPAVGRGQGLVMAFAFLSKRKGLTAFRGTETQSQGASLSAHSFNSVVFVPWVREHPRPEWETRLRYIQHQRQAIMRQQKSRNTEAAPAVGSFFTPIYGLPMDTLQQAKAGTWLMMQRFMRLEKTDWQLAPFHRTADFHTLENMKTLLLSFQLQGQQQAVRFLSPWIDVGNANTDIGVFRSLGANSYNSAYPGFFKPLLIHAFPYDSTALRPAALSSRHEVDSRQDQQRVGYGLHERSAAHFLNRLLTSGQTSLMKGMLSATDRLLNPVFRRIYESERHAGPLTMEEKISQFSQKHKHQPMESQKQKKTTIHRFPDQRGLQAIQLWKTHLPLQGKRSMAVVDRKVASFLKKAADYEWMGHGSGFYQARAQSHRMGLPQLQSVLRAAPRQAGLDRISVLQRQSSNISGNVILSDMLRDGSIFKHTGLPMTNIRYRDASAPQKSDAWTASPVDFRWLKQAEASEHSTPAEFDETSALQLKVSWLEDAVKSMPQINYRKIAEKVYQEIEKKLTFERQRRGL